MFPCPFDLFIVRKLLSSGVSPDVCNEDGLTALHQVCTYFFFKLPRRLMMLLPCDNHLSDLTSSEGAGSANNSFLK
jgi:ankyrin repeat protein